MLPPIPLHTKNEWILGRHRAEWVVHAVKAIIGSTDAHLRWLLVQAGPEEFLRVSRMKFLAAEPSIRYTEDECRWMFKVIQATMPPRFQEAMAPREIARFQQKIITDDELKGDTLQGDGSVPGHDGPSTRWEEEGILTETLPDREKRIVH